MSIFEVIIYLDLHTMAKSGTLGSGLVCSGLQKAGRVSPVLGMSWAIRDPCVLGMSWAIRDPCVAIDCFRAEKRSNVVPSGIREISLKRQREASVEGLFRCHAHWFSKEFLFAGNFRSN